MYEVFEHTADLGLRVMAGDLQTLFAEAGRALFSIVVANLDDVKPVLEKSYSLEFEPIEGEQTEGDKHVYLLFDWLTELLYTFDSEGLLLSSFDVRLSEDGLSATCQGEIVDPQRHKMDHEVKAITYHELKVEHGPDGWLAEVIVDI